MLALAFGLHYKGGQMVMKRIFILALTVLLVFGFAALCVAEDFSTTAQSLELNYKYYYLNYTEVLADGSFFNSETGWQNGVNLVYKIKVPGNKWYQISYELTNHTTDYNGAYQDGTPVKGTHPNQITWHRYRN